MYCLGGLPFASRTGSINIRKYAISNKTVTNFFLSLLMNCNLVEKEEICSNNLAFSRWWKGPRYNRHKLSQLCLTQTDDSVHIIVPKWQREDWDNNFKFPVSGVTLVTLGHPCRGQSMEKPSYDYQLHACPVLAKCYWWAGNGTRLVPFHVLVS